ncbi:MAG TPA: Qat anti-phage system QueC-like protein QatC [Thermoanaerobaculia bacterium]|jgi:7-cyano-7-deazaguanine synthase in queuosine biosynthesis|nr:Qat anti-phage system QueC-like protein QatC [Thermoanaerobaculia bacterium]
MTWKILTIAGAQDAYEAPQRADDKVLRVPFNVPGDPDRLQSSIVERFAQFALTMTPAAEDLLNFAIAAYTADVRVSRHDAFDSWTRDFELHLFVHDVATWERCRATAEELLSFLTGDHWVLCLRPTPDTYTREVREVDEVTPAATEVVCLFSGGLDSFVGALDALDKFGAVTLVGHHAQGAGATSKSQSDAIESLRYSHRAEVTPFVQLWLSPPKGEARAAETTTRGRSILFLALGASVAAGMGAKRLIVPENGVISLNVPLTPSRLGSFSTRTTHPHMIELFRAVLKEIGVDVTIELPYRFATKGEMLRQCRDQNTLAAGLPLTMSCARPAAGRFDHHSPNSHCGRCVPCIIRRAAILAAEMPDQTEYVVTDVGVDLPGLSGDDIRVLRLALERFSKRAPGVRDILRSGPLPGTDEDLREYLGVFVRGLSEIRNLF